MLASIQEKVSLLSEVPEAVAFYLDPEFPIEEAALEKARPAAPLLKALAETFAGLQNWSTAKESVGTTAIAAGAKPGQLMFPLRVALSGKSGGPDLGVMLEILGQNECVRRLNRLNTILA